MGAFGLFLDARILFDGLRRNSRRHLAGVTNLRVGGGGAEGAPSLTTRHTQRYGAAREQREHDGLDDLKDLFLTHNSLIHNLVNCFPITDKR